MTSLTSTSPTTASPATAVDGFLAAIVGATIPAADVWTDDATLDATVPNWRFTARGADELRRLTTGDGTVVVEYLLTWEDAGVPHAAHHVHLLTLAPDGRIAEDHVFCGGRWDAALMAEMEAAGG
jgi:hypothetical protein